MSMREKKLPVRAREKIYTLKKIFSFEKYTFFLKNGQKLDKKFILTVEKLPYGNTGC
ncbi:hypothetical protein TPHV1_200013 [Treponema phagedenis]|uniref:Uncharacterized protein n=1 Tax=Treponema phagedenis TaxID=162 RepID=A0A0B7GTB3_TREPH|nr:hypothetical protein TPHV1_200013 [Treponema phagedenis]